MHVVAMTGHGGAGQRCQQQRIETSGEMHCVECKYSSS